MTDLETYLAGLTVSQGRRAGERLVILPWQRRFIAGAFAPGAAESALSIARGNGKTTLVAGIACAALDGPLAVPRAETVIVGSSYGQGRIAYDHIRAFMADRLADRSVWRVQDTMQSASIEHRETGARVKVIGSDPKRAHGLAPSLMLLDEPAQWPTSTGDKMVAALRTAAGKQPQTRLIALGTRPVGTDHWFARLLAGGADYAQTHAADPDDPKWRVSTWRKANPSLPHMPDLEAAIRREAKNVKGDPALVPEFDALRLNLGTADTATATLLDAGTWVRIEGEADRTGPLVWGLDLGTSAAQSVIAAYWPQTGALDAVAAFPSRPSLAERGIRDGVAGLYQDMANRGELILTGGNAVDIGGLIAEALARFGRPDALACDRWREAELRDALDRSAVPVAALIVRGQGFRDGGEDVRDFRRACLEGRVVPGQSLLLRNAMSEARVVVDPAGNSKLAKNAEGGRRVRARDDAAAAAILAVAEGYRKGAKPAPRRLRSALAG